MAAVYARKLIPFRQIESYSIAHIGENKFFFNESGTKILNLVDGKSSTTEIALALARSLNAHAVDKISTTVSAFLEKLYSQGLLWKVENGYFKGVSNGNSGPSSEAYSSESTQKVASNGVGKNIRAVQEDCMTPKSFEETPTSIQDQIEKLYWDKNYIQKMHLELTYRCNFRCAHCYNTTHGGGTSELTTNDWHRALDELAGMGCLLLTFTGGEVFVRKDIIDILQYACEKGFSIRLNTNGSLIDEKMMQHLEPMRPFLQSFDISIYGADALVHDTLAQRPGSFYTTRRALRLLRDANMPVVSKFITMRGNFDGIEKFEEEMKKLGVRHVVGTGSLIPQTDRNTKPLVQLLTDDQYKKMMSTRTTKGFSRAGQCKPGHVRGAITPDGYVSPCEWLTDLKYGNLKEGSLREIWYSPGFLAFRRRFVEEHSECPSCHLRPGCSRCPAHSYLETGELFQCAPIQRHNAEICRELGVVEL